MIPHADINWWDFKIDTVTRSDSEKAKIKGAREVNRPQGKRHILEYHEYLGLDKLLNCQVPSSKIPDERVFIITHQLFELAFKLMIFDFNVIAETFEELLSVEGNDRRRFKQLCKAEGLRDEDFWRPSLTASARLKFTSEKILPIFMNYLGKGDDETFSSIEFYYFRDNLAPASGFQTAQFRLIQRALGKDNLLSVRLFPSETFRQNYGGKKNGPVRVTDEIILRSGVEVATPSSDSPLAKVAQLDELAHAILAKMPRHQLKPPAIKLIYQTDIDRACDLLENLLENRRLENRRRNVQRNDSATVAKDAETLKVFKEDLTAAVKRENERRVSLAVARGGALYLREEASESYLSQVLGRIVATDDNLFGLHNKSFLAVHLRVAISRIKEAKKHALKIRKPEPPSGTGGGGPDYLGYSRSSLIPLFRAVVAYRGL